MVCWGGSELWVLAERAQRRGTQCRLGRGEVREDFQKEVVPKSPCKE